MSLPLSVFEGLELHPRTLSGSKLIDDYNAGASSLGPFYAGYPWSVAAFRAQADRVRGAFPSERLEALRTSVEPTSADAAEKLARIAEGEGFVVTTGQQAGLFGGPLYTTYKILTAVRLAGVLEQLLRVPVAPLFWVPADDADWDEVNHVHLVDAKNQLVRIQLDGAAEPQVSMANRRISDGIAAALAQVEQTLPQNEFAADQLAALRKFYAPGRSVAEAYRDLIIETFGSLDLLITSSTDPALKRFAAPVFRTELENAAKHGDLLRAQTDRLVQAGYHEQVAIATDASNVMFEDEHGRERLVRDGEEWVLRRTKRRFTHAEVIALLEAEPERFSANVLLRPVVESFAFPTLAYVGGPAEVSYFAQTGCLFAAHGVDMPLVFPRASADLVEAKVRKVLDKFTLEPADLQRPFHELASQIAREELPLEVSAQLHQLRESLTQGYGELVQATTQIDATLRGPLESARNASYKQVDDVERKILTHLKRQGEVGLEQLRKAAINLFPDGARQERVIGTLYFLGKYGPGFLTAVADLLNLEIGGREAQGWDGVRCG